MLKHIVLFRFRGDLSPADRRVRAKAMKKIFQPLESLASVSAYRVGINFSESENSWDLAIDSEFESEEKLEEYRVSAEHQSAIVEARKFEKDKCVVDYYI